MIFNMFKKQKEEPTEEIQSPVYQCIRPLITAVVKKDEKLKARKTEVRKLNDALYRKDRRIKNFLKLVNQSSKLTEKEKMLMSMQPGYFFLENYEIVPKKKKTKMIKRIYDN